MALQVMPPIVQVARLVFGRPTPGDQLTLLWLIATACEQELPLAPAVEALSTEARSAWRGRLEDFAALLRRGVGVAQAIERVPGLLPPDAILAAKVGAETDSLGPALRTAAEWQAQQFHDAQSPSTGGTIFYVAAVIAVMVSVILYTSYEVLPRYYKIFEDFGVELPEITQTLIALIDASQLLLIPMLSCALLLPVFWLVWSSGARFQFLSPRKYLPRLDIGPVLQQLGVVVEDGKNLTDGLRVLASQHPNATVWRRLSFVFEGVTAGENCWLLMQKKRLLRTRERQLLESAERTGNLGWALKTLGQQIERKQDARGSAMLQLVKPICICALAIPVLFFGVAMIVPIIKLISDMS